MMQRHSHWFVLSLVAFTCKRPAPSPEQRPLVMATHFAMPNSGAFDLASSDEGAALVTADANQSGLSVTRFDKNGNRVGSAPLFDPKRPDAPRGTDAIAEVGAASLAGELLVTWVDRSAAGSHLRHILRPLSEPADAPVGGDQEPIAEPIAAPRGNLALAINDGQYLVLSRQGNAPCIDPERKDCVGFSVARVDPGGNVHSAPLLSVPLPCERSSVSFAVSVGRFYYGVCSRATGEPVTTLFSIQSTPAYARADRILEGCLPLGASAVDEDLIVIGDCAGVRRAVRVRSGNESVVEVQASRLEAVCEAGKPVIRQIGPAGLRLVLGARRDRLEAFLPPELSLPFARAVWTGQTLLVSGVVEGKISLKGFRCDSTLLRPVALGAG